MVKAIVFDKDGTLLALSNAWDQPAVEISEFFLNQTQLSEVERAQVKTSLGIVNGRVQANSLFATASIRQQAEFFTQLMGKRNKFRVEKTLTQIYLKFIQAHPQVIQLNPGALEVLSQLSQDYILALVTNDSRILTDYILKQAGIYDFFDFIACADEFPAKPEPDALLALAEKFNLNLADMVYVGDSEVDMVYGSLTQAAIAYDPKGHKSSYLAKADYWITDLYQLFTLLDTL